MESSIYYIENACVNEDSFRLDDKRAVFFFPPMNIDNTGQCSGLKISKDLVFYSVAPCIWLGPSLWYPCYKQQVGEGD